jgi:soluble lytic murein transglycosylase
MKRALVVALLALTLILAVIFLNRYWVHRYDALIAQQASIYRVDPDLVWSIIYEETYFSPWKVGQAGEIGLMQVTPTVAKEWATETGMREFERQVSSDAHSFLRDPEHNIQIGCWYLEKIHEQFQDSPDPEARMIAGYNAGPSRAAEWNKAGPDGKLVSAAEFIKRIDIPSTRAYVTSILQRYQTIKGEKSQGATLRDANTPVNE